MSRTNSVINSKEVFLEEEPTKKLRTLILLVAFPQQNLTEQFKNCSTKQLSIGIIQTLFVTPVLPTSMGCEIVIGNTCHTD